MPDLRPYRARLANVLESARHRRERPVLEWFAAAVEDVTGDALEDAAQIYAALWLLDQRARDVGDQADSVDGELRLALRRLASGFGVAGELVERLCSA